MDQMMLKYFESRTKSIIKAADEVLESFYRASFDDLSIGELRKMHTSILVSKQWIQELTTTIDDHVMELKK